MLEPCPESIESARARIQLALMPLYILPLEEKDVPGYKREHVFDFADGRRCVLSRVQFVNGNRVLHFSMSFWHTAQWLAFINLVTSKDEVLLLALQCLKELTGLEETGVCSGYFNQAQGIPNLYWAEGAWEHYFKAFL